MIFLELFLSFLKIGFTSFGGLSIISLVSDEMTTHGWMTVSEVSDIIAIAEMTPGPLGLNCATFAGMRTGGLPGAIIANIGVLFPSFSLCLVAAIFFEKFRNSRRLNQILVGIRPACIGLVFGIVFSLSVSNYTSGGLISVPCCLIGALDLFLLLKMKASIPVVILISAGLGLLFFGLI